MDLGEEGLLKVGFELVQGQFFQSLDFFLLAVKEILVARDLGPEAAMLR